MTDTATTPTEYVFPNYWGGATRGPTPPLIHAKLRELRLLVGGVEAKRQQGGPAFPVKSAKDLANRLAQALVDLDLIAPVIAQEVTFLDTDKIPGNVTGSGKPVFRTLVHVKATVRIAAADGSYVDVVGSGHGGDADDKAGGKASTYAWKDAILKGLTTPEKDMVDTDDEAPSEEREVKEAPKRGRKAVADAGSDVAAIVDATAVNKSLNYVLAQIERSATVEELDKLATAIKDGILGLNAKEKLQASQPYVRKRAELMAAKPVSSAAELG